MKPIILAATLVTAGVWAGQLEQPAAPPTLRLAVMSTQRVMAESSEARAIVARQQARQQQRNTELKTMQQALEETRGQLSKANDAAERDTLERKERQQSDLQANQRQVLTELRAIINPVLADVVKDRNLQIILSSDVSVVWAAPGLDVTSEVVQRLNARPTSTAPPKPH